MKRVLFLIPTLGYGGAEKVLVNLVNNLDKSKFDVTVQTLFDCGINKQFLSSDVKYRYSFKRFFRGSARLFLLWSPQTLYKRLVKEKYDIVVSYLEGVTARIVSGCVDEDTKLVNWIHCKLDTPEVISSAFRSFEEAKKCYSNYDYTVCVSQMVKDYFVKALSFSEKTGVLYNTIETDIIIEKSLEPVTDVVFDQDCVNICAVGKIVPVKGFERLAAIHKRLKDEKISNKVYILGVGSEKKKLEKYLRDNKLEDTFIFLGYKTNPYKYIKNSDLYVCSSYSEGFSTAVTESLIVGTPVVTTRCSGMEEQLGCNNEYGIITDNNEQALYEGIKEMITTEGCLEKYAEKALERGKSFNKEITVKAVEDMLEKL
ncbi:MAG: glycosyltransferase [Acutalibacteraceae bacterium]|nr:glycosyltransferase [Acutalibacteraceae bacterium]